MSARYVLLAWFFVLVAAASCLAMQGCGKPPTISEQARACREACREAGTTVLRMEERNAAYMDGTPCFRCVCGEVPR